MSNKELVELFVSPIRECMEYKPHFGDSSRTGGYSLPDFLSLYGSDPFYSWIGLDSPYMYSAHKAAGSMTSIYRQIGIGCERLFREVIFEKARYKEYTSAQWSYETETRSGKKKVLSLDGRLELSDIRDTQIRDNVEDWIKGYLEYLDIQPRRLNGAVFEVRQGYKSKDSKRQNADLDNATVAYSYNYLPVFTIFSSQIDNDIALRYRNGKCGILTGKPEGDIYTSLYEFSRQILDFDLAAFFQHNSTEIKNTINQILAEMFSADEAKK